MNHSSLYEKTYVGTCLGMDLKFQATNNNLLTAKCDVSNYSDHEKTKNKLAYSIIPARMATVATPLLDTTSVTALVHSFPSCCCCITHPSISLGGSFRIVMGGFNAVCC